MGNTGHTPSSRAPRHDQASPAGSFAGARTHRNPRGHDALFRPHPLGLATAAALACLMAGCGDGTPTTDQQPTVKATSGAPASHAGQRDGQQANGSTAAGSSQQANGTGTASGSAADSSTAAAGKADGNATASAAGPVAIDAKGISGRVLQAMLLEGTQWNGKTPTARVWPAYPWQGPGPKGSPDLDALGKRPNVLGGQSLTKSGQDDRHYAYSLDTQAIPSGAASTAGTGTDAAGTSTSTSTDFAALNVTLPMEITGEGYFLPRYEGRQYEGFRDKVSIALTRTASVQVADGKTTRTQQFSAPGTPRTIGFDGRFSFNDAIQEWQQPDGSRLQLLLLAGASAREARLCLNTQLPELQRLTCTIWQVPENVDTGGNLEYRGLYVVDDRKASSNPAEEAPATPDRQLYWQSSAAYPGYANPAVGPNGVRGDAVAAALTQIVEIVPWGLGEAYRGWSASLWSGPGPDGHAIQQEGVPPGIEGWSSFQEPSDRDNPPSPPHYHTQFTSFLHQEYTQQYPGFAFNSLTAALTLEAHMGRYFDGYHDGQDSFFTPGRFLFGVDGDPVPGRELLTLGSSVHAKAEAGYGPIIPDGTQTPGDGTVSLSTDHNTSLYADRMVPPEPAVQTWTNVQGEKVALSVQGVAQQAPYERQFWLCLQQEVLKTRRTTCSRWEVPAEWRLDLPLTFRGIRVTDDLTSSGQPGQVRYWMTDISQQQIQSAKSLRTQQRKALVRKAIQKASAGGQP